VTNNISADDIVLAVTIITIMLVILAVPSILVTVRNSAKLLKRYRALRSINDLKKAGKEVPPQILDEWNAVHSPMAYTTLITEEIERLNGLKPAFFQAELAALLIVILAIYPGYETNVLIMMMLLLLLIVLSIVYGIYNTKMYTQEYLKILKDVSDSDEPSSADGMYG
jgi:ABC-type transport system involved in cytochrome bd biosynthesis fused ATPase/permease subunit